MGEEWTAGLAAELDDELRARAVPERAAGEKAYLKSELTHYGASVPAMRAAVRAAMAGLTLGHDDLVALVEALWAEPVHERRAAAVELLETHRALLDFTDADLLERLLRESRTWALVDSLAASVVGPISDGDPAWEPPAWWPSSTRRARRRSLRSELCHSAPNRASTRTRACSQNAAASSTPLG